MTAAYSGKDSSVCWLHFRTARQACLSAASSHETYRLKETNAQKNLAEYP
jgi:hypothetical protein